MTVYHTILSQPVYRKSFMQIKDHMLPYFNMPHTNVWIESSNRKRDMIISTISAKKDVVSDNYA